MNAISFMCEHTAEYLLTRCIVDVLTPVFGSAIPVHFWLGREGSTMALRSMAGRPVRILPVYARRPKIMQPGQDWVLMRINDELLDAASVANPLGCPVLAGLPLVTDLWDVSPSTSCAWFHITNTHVEASACEFQVSVNEPSTTPSHHPNVYGPIPEDALASYIRDHSRVMHWAEAIEAIREIRSDRLRRHRFLFGAMYKPFFVILPVG